MPHNISYTNIASILLKEVNRIRNNPQLLIPILEERAKKYDEDCNYFPLAGLNFSVTTKEGTQGVMQLIQFLKKQRECASLEWSFQLHQAADKRCHFLSSTQQKNVFNRVANLQIGQLVSQFTTWKGHLSQLTFYGFIEPHEFICEMLLQDGREEKENRVEFFNRVSCYVGIGINAHEKYRFVIVMILAMQVANHEPFYSYKTLSQPKTPPPPSLKALKSSKSISRQLQVESERGRQIEPVSHETPVNGSENMAQHNVGGQMVEQRGYEQRKDRNPPIASDQTEVNLECKLDDCQIY